MPSLESQWEMAIEDWDRHDDDCKCSECYDDKCSNSSYPLDCNDDCDSCRFRVKET